MSDQPPRHAERDRITITSAQLRFASWMTDVLVYTVVLNLFVEYADAVVIDPFTISIFTAVLLKALLDAILHFEHRVDAWFAEREGAAFRALAVGSTLLILFLSKFVILEVVDLVFGDHVELGGLVEVVLLVIVLMVSRQAFQWIYDRLGSAGARPAA